MTSTLSSLRQRRSLSSFRQQLALRLLTRKKRSKLAQGFTLVELMVVIVIVGILAAVALPNFLSQSSKAKVTEAQAKISAALKSAGAEYQSSSTFVGMTAASLGLTNTTNFTFVCTPDAALSISCVGTGQAGAAGLGSTGVLTAATGQIVFTNDTTP
jgi:type IV pilus assembly protein PilA